MKIKKKGLITVAVALLMLAVIVPVYALGDPSGTLHHLRTQDPDCEHQGPATRAYGEDSPIQTQEPEELSEEEALEEVETPIQEQTQTQEQLRKCDCENADCEENQYQYQCQHQFQEQCRYGQEED
jgi:hypothetical protein